MQLYIAGFKQVANKNIYGCDYTLYVDEASNRAKLTCIGRNLSIASGSSNYEASGWIPSKYKPSESIHSLVQRGNVLIFFLWNSGICGLTNLQSTTLTNTSWNIQVEYSF